MNINRRLFIVLLCVSSLLFVFASCSIGSDKRTDRDDEETFESEERELNYSEGLEFVSRGDGTAILTGIGSCSDTTIIIPTTTPDGDRVAEIGDYAFNLCSDIEEIEVPDGVTTIGIGAFSLCSNLSTVVIPDSVSIIGVMALGCCDSLTEVVLPSDFTVFSGSSYESSDAVGCGIFIDTYSDEIDNDCLVNGIGELDWLNAHGYIELQERVAAVESHNAEIAAIVEQLENG